MNFLQAYFISKVLARSTKSKPRTAGEILKDSALGWLYFLVFVGGFIGLMMLCIWLMTVTNFLTVTVLISVAGVAFLAYKIPRMKR